jgi:predicted ATPase with chaperone activity
MHGGSVDTAAKLAEVLKLPQRVVQQLLEEASAAKLVEALGVVKTLTGAHPRYGLSARGREWAQQAFEQNSYVGPAPIPLADYVARIQRQAIGDERVSAEAVARALGGLIVSDDLVNKVGPAINSGRPMLLYGPPGNGKTSIAARIGSLFNAIVFVPHCFEVGGQIVKVFDPDIHREVQTDDGTHAGSIRATGFDRRWVPCRRPFVVAGGELTLEMLDLRFNALAKFYEAPLHVKALNGVFLIDDFGRQLVAPTTLLNRWIVPLENRVDYLKLHTGKSFALPFDELVIFSTNMPPSQLMDAAFLRRLPYKIEVGAPSREEFQAIFRSAARSHGLEATDDVINHVLAELTERNDFPLAAYQPEFIVRQVVASCKFRGIPPQFHADMLAFAIANLFTKDSPGYGVTAARRAPNLRIATAGG